jgi:hypothetical protein
MDPKLIATLLVVLGFAELNSVDGLVSLSKEDVGKIQASHKEKFGAELTLQGITFDEDGHATLQEAEIIQIEAALNKEAPAASTDDPPGGDTQTDAEKKLQAQVITLTSKIKNLEASQRTATETIIKLGAKPETDLEVVGPGAAAGKTVIMHSKTHLFASNKSFDAFADRPWNQRLAGKIKAATDYTTVDIQRINADLGAYYREDQTALISFLRAKDRLPSFWGTVSNIQDEIAYAKAFTGEVTQARKKKWLPKGGFEFQPEIAKVFPIQIDEMIAGSELQSMETSWLNHLEMIKKSGSQPYKMSFVHYLAGEILKKAAEEDQIGHVRGIFIPTADDATEAGLAIHKQRGLMKLVKDAQKRRVYMPYDLGTPTEANIVDYVEDFVKRIPEYWRDMPNMVFYMASYWVEAYLKRREVLKGTQTDYKGDNLYVARHENIRLEPLAFMNDAKFMFITTNDNISKLENIPSEKKLLNLEMDKRDIAIFADYKIGIHVWAFGYEYPVGTDLSDDKQIFFSNDIEILPDLYVPLADKVSTPSVKYHTSLRTFENTGATAITDILDSSIGDYIYIKGNKGANPSTIANTGKFDLEAALTLSENVLILLYKRAADDFVEIERWDTSLSNTVFLVPDATIADADKGKHFVTSENTVATALTDITNAVDGDIYVIEGGSDTNKTTIAATGKFSRITATMTLTKGHWLKVKYNGLKFVELERYTG